MDILIAFLLLFLATYMALGHTVKIEVVHKHEMNKDHLIPVPDEKPKDPDKRGEDEPTTNLDEVIHTINEIMGVTDEDGSQRLYD